MAQAAAAGGDCLLRIEDLDPGRSRAAYVDAILEDLTWLGLSWPEPVLRQSTRTAAYRHAIDRLLAGDLLYPCFCTRREIEAEIASAAQAPHRTDGPQYPGTCRDLPARQRESRLARGDVHVLRLNAARAAAQAGALSFDELGSGPRGESGMICVDPAILGDVVLTRRDAPAAYHLAVVVDDAFQGVTLVTRGEDLFPATHVQRLLQAVLGLPAPLYAHHRLILDDRGCKLSKRSGSASLTQLRSQGISPAAIRARFGVPPAHANSS
jgi:glutamyl-Q tRNA(Asp) synthetase